MPLFFDLTTFYILWQKFVKFFVVFLEHLRLSKRHSEINWPLLATFPPGRDTFLSPSQSLGEQGLTFSFFLYLQHAQCTYSHYPLCIEVHSRVHKSRYSPNTVIQCVRLAPFFILAVLFWTGLVLHTVILPYWTFKKWALSSFAFQSF